MGPALVFVLARSSLYAGSSVLLNLIIDMIVVPSWVWLLFELGWHDSATIPGKDVSKRPDRYVHLA